MEGRHEYVDQYSGCAEQAGAIVEADGQSPPDIRPVLGRVPKYPMRGGAWRVLPRCRLGAGAA